MDYEMNARAVSMADVETRATFISRTYFHVLGAMAAFTGIEIYLFQSGMALPIAKAMLGGSWLLVLGGFMVVSWLATHLAHQAKSKAAQYLGLAGYVIADAIIFVPLLYIANQYAPGTIESAAGVTLAGTLVLTAIAHLTRKDFSFLRNVIMWGGVCALIMIVAGAIFGFVLGTVFSVGMIALAGAAVLYDTSNIIHYYPEDRYVGASLQLFASIALMFWYVLRIFLSSKR